MLAALIYFFSMQMLGKLRVSITGINHSYNPLTYLTGQHQMATLVAEIWYESVDLPFETTSCGHLVAET